MALCKSLFNLNYFRDLKQKKMFLQEIILLPSIDLSISQIPTTRPAKRNAGASLSEMCPPS